jgi:hypothetical protein
MHIVLYFLNIAKTVLRVLVVEGEQIHRKDTDQQSYPDPGGSILRRNDDIYPEFYTMTCLKNLIDSLLS